LLALLKRIKVAQLWLIFPVQSVHRIPKSWMNLGAGACKTL
jgi:hypothetical protein